MRLRRLAVLAVAVATGILLAGCGNDNAPVPPSAPPVAAPVQPSAATTTGTSGASPAAGVPLAPRVQASLPLPPEADYVTLAKALGRVPPDADVPEAVTPRQPKGLGQPEQFWLVALEARRVDRINATLRLSTPNAYWYVQDGERVSDAALQSAAQALEERIFPAVERVFGPPPGSPPWGAPLTILHGKLDGAAGYFSGADSLPEGVFPHSNERPMLYMDTRIFSAGGQSYQSVLAHELQHAFHFYADRGEESWVDEGLSEFSSEVAGYRPSGSDTLLERYLDAPGTSLVEWAVEPRQTAPNYGGAHLFFRYFVQHYGGTANVRKILEEQEDGTAGISAYLKAQGYQERFLDVFAEWLAANALGSQGTARYQYATPPPIAPRRAISASGTVTGNLPQFGADYLRVTADRGDVLLTFAGDVATRLLPASPASGNACYWGNRGDFIMSSMTREMDLRAVVSATLQFKAWYDLEEDWDYAYVQVSANGGRTWDVLRGTHTVDANPVGNSYGPGLTGKSVGWVEERVDLSPYAGRVVRLRFQYVTDQAINSHGICIDDIAVPEVGFNDGAEYEGVWEMDGFAATDLVLVQQWVVQVVERQADGQAIVRRISADAGGKATVRLSGFGAGLKEAVVVISPVTEPTRVSASYTLSAAQTQ